MRDRLRRALPLATLTTALLTIGNAHASEPTQPQLGCAANGLTPELGVNWGFGLDAGESWDHVEGDPLLVAVGSSGSLSVWTCQPGPRGIQPQFYGGDAWGANVWLAGSEPSAHYRSRYYGGSGSAELAFAPLGQEVTRDGDRWTVTTQLALGADALLTRIVSYTLGSRSIGTRWELTNASAAPFHDVRFFDGGDALLGGDDAARSWWSPAQNTIYLDNGSVESAGIMSFAGSAATPADHFFGGGYAFGKRFASEVGALPDTWDPSPVDAGIQLQWDRAVLMPGETWVIEATQGFTDPSYAQVLAPQDRSAPRGLTGLPFTVRNLDAAPHTFVLSAKSHNGWPAQVGGASEVTIAAGGELAVIVEITIPDDASVTDVGDVMLSAYPVDGDGAHATTRVEVLDINLGFDPPQLDFGALALGAAASHSVTITNLGARVELGWLGLDGVVAPFSLADDQCSYSILAHGESCRVVVWFTSASATTFVDDLAIPVRAPMASSHLMSMRASGYDPCADGVLDGDETDVDCGGSRCAPCVVAPSCFDHLRNGDETGVDCGASCSPCAIGAACSRADDCQSGLCADGFCQQPGCTDGIHNLNETDVDCGGPSCGRCDLGQACAHTVDCKSGLCAHGHCVLPSCLNGIVDGDETGVDCGGTRCGACLPIDPCADGCLAVPTCDDGSWNQDEQDVDCGGSCAPCVVPPECVSAADCDSGVCVDGACRAPSCEDGVRNQDEVMIDCGGTSCGSCSVPRCGDGSLDAGEGCDDGDHANGDGCDKACGVEIGWSCELDGDGASVCETTCGDGARSAPESCDDGNDRDGDGCDPQCEIELGWACSDQLGVLSTCSASCGDGVFAAGHERCDDGDLLGGDGCSAACRIEAGWVCTGAMCTCVDIDHDGVDDDQDNCIDTRNLDQADLDRDGLGDACDLDVDGDALPNMDEVVRGTDLRDADSDDDGVEDGHEVMRRTNPLSATDDAEEERTLSELTAGGSGCAGGGAGSVVLAIGALALLLRRHWRHRSR